MDPVTENEKALKKWKEETRRDALENEIERLKSLTTGQAVKIRRITIALFAAIAILIASLSTIWAFSSSDEKSQPTTANKAQEDNSTETPPLQRDKELTIISPLSDTIKLLVPENGIIFSIQIGAYLSHDLQRFNNNMISLHQYSSEYINQFTLGLFTNYTAALEFRDIVKKLGFSDAYVTAIKNGKRINLDEAIHGAELPEVQK
jgi:hypothetical protein